MQQFIKYAIILTLWGYLHPAQAEKQKIPPSCVDALSVITPLADELFLNIIRSIDMSNYLYLSGQHTKTVQKIKKGITDTKTHQMKDVIQLIDKHLRGEPTIHSSRIKPEFLQQTIDQTLFYTIDHLSMASDYEYYDRMHNDKMYHEELTEIIDVYKKRLLFVLENGADVNAEASLALLDAEYQIGTSNITTPLSLAMTFDLDDVVEILINYGADVYNQIDVPALHVNLPNESIEGYPATRFMSMLEVAKRTLRWFIEYPEEAVDRLPDDLRAIKIARKQRIIDLLENEMRNIDFLENEIRNIDSLENEIRIIDFLENEIRNILNR